MKIIALLWASIYLLLNSCEGEEAKLKVLHLSFHKGCIKEFDSVAQKLSIDLHNCFIPDLPPYFFDGITQGNALYNIGHERADRIWNLHKNFFESFDLILTSDTAPLSRIFLQNGLTIPLVIWICNRFDYYDAASLDCDFPDPEYYHLFEKAANSPNVTIVAYTGFEHYYAQTKGINTGSVLIKPCGNEFVINTISSIPASINKSQYYFLPPYHNEKNFMNLSSHLQQMGIPNYQGRYNGPFDLKDFKAIIHLPYSWSNLALFENTSLGIPYFIPTITFFENLVSKGNYFHPSLHELIRHKLYYLSEWYCEENKNYFVYFDSWDDLKHKIENTDFSAWREKVKYQAQNHQILMIDRWRQIFQDIKVKPS